MIEAVVFDIGGVLIDWNPRYLYRSLFDTEAEVEEFLALICTNSWNEQFDAGMTFAAGIAALQQVHPDKADFIDAYWQRWHEMLGGEIPGTPKLLQRLIDANIPVHAISNWSAETFPRARERFAFLDAFDVLVVSGREKMIKPGREIFDLFIERAGLQPSSCLFVDDNPANISTAARLGFETEQFVNAVQLELRLKALGLLTGDEQDV